MAHPACAACGGWVREHWDDLRDDLEAVSPTPPAYATVWSLLVTIDIDMEQVEAHLQQWVETVFGRAVPCLSADAKTLRGSRRVADQLPGLQVLSLVAQPIDVVLHQVQVAADADLVAALITLVQRVPVADQVLTVDAGLLHARTTRVVQAHGGTYLGPVKANQPCIKADIDQYLQEGLITGGAAWPPPSSCCHDVREGARAP